MLELYKNIKRRREELGISQDELAQKTGYTSRSSIAKIEKGLVDLPQTKISLFANALKATPQELMGWISSDDDDSLIDYFNKTMDEIILFLNKNGYTIFRTDSWNDNTVIVKNQRGETIKTTTDGDLVGQYEKIKMEHLPKTVENILNISSMEMLPENIRAAARGMMDLSPDDQKTAIDMINYLSQKGKEAKRN